MLASNEQNSALEPPDGKPFTLANGFNSVHYSPDLPEVEICPKEKASLEYKQNLARDIVAALLRASDNALMAAQALRIAGCNSDDNLFVAEDLHNADGEAFNGKGTLWSCNSRLCPNCVGRLSNRSRKTIRYVMENQKLLVGENWYFVTFTMPNLNLKNLPLPTIAQIMQAAWKRFTALETRANKRQTWYQETIRGGFKNCEFTYTENDVYHYHIHSLLIANSGIKADDFFNVRAFWTDALKFAFKKFGLPFEINTADELAVVNVKLVETSDREKAIRETAKYVTKNDSWSKIPIEQLETIVAVPRFWRMFESFGVCRETAREVKRNTASDAKSESDNRSEKLTTDTNLDTNELINRQNEQATQTEEKIKRVAWRIRAMQIPFLEYRDELREEIESVQTFRRRQLQEKYACASFQTLSGETFTGDAYHRHKFTTVLMADTDLGAWYSARIPSRQSPGVLKELRQLERASPSQSIPIEADASVRTPSKPINAPYPLPLAAPTVKAKRLSSWDIFNSFCDLGSDTETENKFR